MVETLAHAGIACEVDELVDAHGAGRRRITVHARRGGDGELRIGFAAASSHAIVAIEDCPILDPGLRGALDAARALAEALKPAGKPLDIQVTAAEQRPRRRRARLGAADDGADRNLVAASPSNTAWRG